MKKVLVTGGSGFIGSHLVENLQGMGYNVLIIDKKPPLLLGQSNCWSQWDLCHPLPLPSVATPHRYPREFDMIYHLAAMPWVKQKDPNDWFCDDGISVFEPNALATFNLLKHIKKGRVVFTSTANLYGNGRQFKETDSVNLSSMYGYSKKIAENIIVDSNRDYVIFRLGTVVGVRGRTFPNRLVWCAVNDLPVKVFNQGDTIRDLVDIKDVVRALLSARALSGGVYNIGSGTEITGEKLAAYVSHAAEERGYSLSYELTDFNAPGYVPYSSLNIDRILSTGLWKPMHCLEDTVSRLFDYYEKEKDAPEPPRWDRI